jgi:hypothetical protein
LTQEELGNLFAAKFQVTLSQSQISHVLQAEGVAIPGGQHHPGGAKSGHLVDRAGVFFPSSSPAAHAGVADGN